MKKHHIWISLMLVLTLVFTTFAPTAFAAGGGVIELSDASGKAGDQVQVIISLKNNPGIIAATMEVSYDASKLRLVNAKDEGLLKDSIFSDSYSRNPYYLSWNDALATVNNCAEGIIATLTFEILPEAAVGKTEVVLNLSDPEIFDTNLNEVAFTGKNGIITIQGTESGGTGNGSSTGTVGGGGGIIEEEAVEEEVGETVPEIEKVGGAELYAKYTDLKANAWYRTFVEFMLEKGYMSGMSETAFQPNGTITRAQLVTILYHMEGSPTITVSHVPFTDVKAESWYGTSVIWAATKGIVSGVGNEMFAPNKAITREQLATILWNYNGAVIGEKSNIDGYKDSGRISSYAVNAVNWAVGSGIISGFSDATLAPSGTATRAQTTAMLYNYIKEFTAIPVPGIADK